MIGLRMLSSKCVDERQALFETVSVHIAGFGLVSIFNVFLILALGVADEEVQAPTSSIRSAYSGNPCAPLA